MKEYIVENYLLIMIISAFLIFALIGYIVDTMKNKNAKNTIEGSASDETLEMISTPDEVETPLPDAVVLSEVEEIPLVEAVQVKKTVENNPEIKKAEDLVLTEEKKAEIIETIKVVKKEENNK